MSYDALLLTGSYTNSGGVLLRVWGSGLLAFRGFWVGLYTRQASVPLLEAHMT